MTAKSVIGKNDWLFLANDSNQVFDQVTGKLPLTHEEVKKLVEDMEDRQAHAKANKYKYIFLIVPNKHCVYSEYLPDEFSLSENRAAIQLTKASNSYFYPLNCLRDAKNTCDVYYKTDTHWNTVGASIVSNKLAEIFEIPASIDMEVMDVEIIGDLGSKFDPKISSKSCEVKLANKGSRHFANNCPNLGGFVVYCGPRGDLPRAIVFGDSFFNTKIHILSQIFSRIYFFHAPIFDKKIIEAIKPDVVISENVERFITANKFKSQTFYEILLNKIKNLENITIDIIRQLNLSNFENIFSDEQIESIVNVADDWIAFGNNDMFSSFFARDPLEGKSCKKLLNLFIIHDIKLVFPFRLLADVLYKAGHYCEAMMSINKAIMLESNNPRDYIMLSHIFVGQGKCKEAIQAVLQAIDIDPYTSRYQAYLSELYKKVGDFEAAEKYSKKAMDL